MKINKKLQTRNCNVKASRDIEWIVIHGTGTDATALANAKYFANNELSSSAHLFVDSTSIWQSVELKNVAWHCGAKTYKSTACRNANSIGIEICNDGTFTSGEITRAAELVQYLMTKFGIDADHVIRHYDVTGKKCPAKYCTDSAWTALKAKLVGTSTSTVTAKVATKSSPLMLRAKASATGKVLKKIPKGKKVTVIARDTAWSKCRYDGATGYAATKYLDF